MGEVSSKNRLSREREHAKVLLRDPEGIWGWGTPAGRARAQRRAELIIEAGRITASSLTLEIGCGTGVFTELVSKSGAKITACELSEELLELAYKKPYASKVDFISHDAARLSSEHDGRYDVVWGSSVLHHLDLKLFLPRMLRLMKPGGRFVFAEPNLFNPQIWLERNVSIIRRLTGTSPDETAFYRWRLTKLLLNEGFVNVSVRPHEFLHPAIPRLLIPMFQSLSTVAERIWPICEIAGSLLIRAERPNA
ncbi:MAG: class I SAM-dependent methyltransferase [Planctomycetota bacterium]|jgi:SAM-dependent methyltransferase